MYYNYYFAHEIFLFFKGQLRVDRTSRARARTGKIGWGPARTDPWTVYAHHLFFEVPSQTFPVPAATPATNMADVKNSNTDTTITAGSSKSDGKKRAVDDDDEATATDEEPAVSEKSSKRRRAQHK